MFDFWGFEWMVIRNVLWPIKGIIYAEFQFVLWHIALGRVLLNDIIPLIIMAFGIYLVFTSVFGMHHHGHVGHHVGGIIRFIGRFLLALTFSWFFLLMGVVAGEDAAARAAATTTVTYRRRFGHLIEASNRFEHLSLHFRLGRWMYRTLHRGLGHIPALAANARVHRIVALCIALVICLWGVWRIPFDLTH